MLSNQNLPIMPGLNLQQQTGAEQIKQKGILAKFGLGVKKEKIQQEVVKEPKSKSGWFRKVQKKRFGYDREEHFSEEVSNAEALLKRCEDNLLFEPRDWKENGIRWKSQLESLAVAAGNLAKIRMHRMTQELFNPPPRPGFFKRLFGVGKSGSE